MIGVPFDTLCDLIGLKGEHHSNSPCRARRSTIPSAHKATSTLKFINGSIAPDVDVGHRGDLCLRPEADIAVTT